MSEAGNKICYDLLMKVFRDNAYASIELNSVLRDCGESDKPYITKLFYGVLERNIYYEYVLAGFASQKPKKPIAVLVKMGYYMLEKMNIPAYAVVDNIVKLCKSVGKSGASGFVNSALRNFAPPKLPALGSIERLSVEYGYPLWLCRLLVGERGYDFVRDMLSYVPQHKTHIRVNTGVISKDKFIAKYGKYMSGDDGALLVDSGFGYYVSRDFIKVADKDDYVVQSAASVAAVNAYLYGLSPENILDVCAAPGGKAVLMASLTGAAVTACDIHKHRVELIRKYAFRCDVRVKTEVNDASKFRPEWKNQFDLVVCDVPCSGIGVAGSKPDILFNRSEKDISALTSLQYGILETASRYVKPGGRLCYSTCTVLKCENEDIVDKFLKSDRRFASEKVRDPFNADMTDKINLFPHINGTDGFFVAVMKKTDRSN